MKRVASLTLAVVGAAILAMPAFAQAPPPPGGDGLPNIDRRTGAPVPAAPGAGAARSALRRSLGPLGDVRIAARPGAVAYIGRADGLLSGPSSADPRDIALAYVREHGEVFGLGKGDLANLRLVARDVSPDGITHLRFNQILDGIESFDSGLDAHVTRDGRLINVSGAPVPGASLPATTPGLDASGALAAARTAAHAGGVPPARTSVKPGPGRVTTFATGEQGRLRWTMGAGGPALAWQMVTDGADGQAYDVLVDAGDGTLLRRQDLTEHLGENGYFRRDPDATPVPTQITMPPAWYDDSAGGTRLWGQFARTYVDPNDEDPAPGAELGGTRRQIPASGGAPAAPDWLYPQSHAFAGATPCPPSGCTWDSATPATSQTNERQAASNLHVLVSRYHDYLAQPPIGFDEASGNFQRTNAGAAGLGGDYVRAEVNDGQGLDNANMSTPPDGGAPRMQMFLFTARDVNGSDDAAVVYHEYTHGLSNRLVVNAAGSSTLTSLQPQMMGEAWSDFYANDLLVAEGTLPDSAAPAEVTTGSYVVGGAGIRAKPEDCPVNPAGVAGCNGVGAGATPVLGGYTYGDIAGTINTSPHNGGEVWAETLWDIREAVGREAALALVTGGMRLSADNPSMLDARDAILQQAVATRSAPGAADDRYAALWGVFAARGMGASASTPSAASTTPTEAFDLPSGLRAGATTLSDPYPGGDADGVIEPGERIAVDQAIQGIGVADLPGVTGTLTSGAPGVTVEDGNAAWPLLGKGRSAVNADPLVVALPAASCAATVPVTISVTSSEGPVVATAAIDPRPGSATPVPIPDFAGGVPGVATSTFTAVGGGTIADVDVRITELRHSFLGDLTVELLHDGVTAQLFSNLGGGAFSGDDIVDAVLDSDAAGVLPSAGAGPITGRFATQPANALDAFDGRPAAGPWTLRITDGAAGDTGTLRRWGPDSAQIACGRAEIPAATTGDASGVVPSAATLAGSVTPNGRATGVRFSYGTTTTYGASTAVQDAGAGDAATAASAPIAGLAPATTYHYRAEAIREGGVVAVTGADRAFTTPGLPAPPPADVPAVIAPLPVPVPGPAPAPALVQARPAFTGKLTVKLSKALVRGRRRATFSFGLSAPATVRVTLTRAAKGVRKGARCVAPGAAKGRSCVRALPAGTTTRAFAKSGAARLALSAAGLRRGRYTATLVATGAAEAQSAPRGLSFTVR